MTFYMLSSRSRDTLSDLMSFFAPKMSAARMDETVLRMRNTIEAGLIIQFDGAARNATATLVIYRALSLPCAQ